MKLRTVALFFAFGIVVSVWAEEPRKVASVDFSKCSASQPLGGQDGWTVPSSCVSPTVRNMLVGDRTKQVAAAPAVKTPPTDIEAKKTSQAFWRIVPPFKDAKPSTIIVQADLMSDGYPPNQAAMAGFGYGTPIQFGIDLFGVLGVRDEQWGAVHPATDSGGGSFEPGRGVWYRLTLELTFEKTDAVRLRLFVRDLFGKDKRVPGGKDVLLFFEGREFLEMPIKNPVEKWDTFWLRTSDTNNSGEGGFLSGMQVIVREKPLPGSDYVVAPLVPVYKPLRTAEELERAIDLRKSDVLLSSRWKRPLNKDDRYDTLKAIADFHATRLEWSYTVTPDYVREIKGKGKIRRFGGTINTMFKTGKQHAEQALPGHLTSRDGKPVTGPWMLPSSLWWGCVNSDEFREYYVERLAKLIESGVDTIHMDDPGLNLDGVKWGGCFCPYCIKGYRQFLKESDLPSTILEQIGNLDAVDPRTMERSPYFTEFQQESVRRFYEIVRKAIREKAGRDVMFSCNNYAGNWPFPAIDFDFGIAEIPERFTNPRYIFSKILGAERLGKHQMFTFVSRDLALNRRAYATVYASGGHAVLPWDVYIHPMAEPRHFTDPEHFADLSGFIRGIASRMDGYVAGPAAGFDFDANSAGGILVSNTESGKEAAVSVFLRKKEGSPPVLHLVSWGDPQKVRVELPPEILGVKEIPKTISFLTPSPYDAGKHRQAEESGNFDELVATQKIAVTIEGGRMVFEVPSFDVWAVAALGE